MHEVTFHDVSTETFNKVMERILGPHEGVRLSTDPDVIECRGVRCTVHHSPQTSTLKISILTTPAIVTAGYVTGWLHDLIIGAKSK